MKIIYFSKRADFIPNLKSKIAQYTCQIRAWSCIEEEIKFSSRKLILFEKYWMLQIKSFFTLFPLSNSSINTKHHSQPHTRNPSPRESPYFVKIFQETWKFEFCFPATSSLSQALNRVLRVRVSKFTSFSMDETAWIVLYMIIHMHIFLEFVF